VKEGDVAVIDLMTPSESRRDYVVEVGDPRFVDEITGALIGILRRINTRP